ncbi:SGNH hydrolase-type esterase domain-containing protein [Lasiosphaeris hirsuta]|uniref:SGNH hydrolase-type esterase domain-containing protein n=1 Tax=Lasiosphaeris hirsuta TaxID=260670 RepID=A0AA40AYU2_9PEZI|nr:SGNH hydrolase-type esterase domain-containing protein [Lasiosphaeris hirsuta]
MKLSWVSMIARLLSCCPNLHTYKVQGTKVRWMPLGDSITDYGCWRAWIWQRFQKDGYDIDLVGGEKAGENCSGLAFDRDHEGHPGFLAIDIVSKSQLVGWLKANPADIITVHLGTNDIYQRNIKTTDITTALGTLIDQMRTSNPATRIIVAQIIPLPAKDKQVQELNSAIPALAASKNSTVSPVWVVNQWTNFTTADLGSDRIHPSASGDIKIADKFYPALVRAISSIEKQEGR